MTIILRTTRYPGGGGRLHLGVLLSVNYKRCAPGGAAKSVNYKRCAPGGAAKSIIIKDLKVSIIKDVVCDVENACNISFLAVTN